MKNGKLQIALVGCGARGVSFFREFDHFYDKIDICATCDIVKEKAESAANTLFEKSGVRPEVFTEYEKLLEKELDAVILASSWKDHVDYSCKAMEKGIAVACEVGGTYSIEQIYRLIRCYEKTKTPYMFLENCCYGRTELLALNLAKSGLLGRVVHVAGGYMHDLRDCLTDGINTGWYRSSEYLQRNCDTYPSHEFLPLARIIDWKDGNRPLYLYSISSPAWGAEDYSKEHYIPEAPANKLKFVHGDIITTVIKWARGETMTLTLDTTLPRYYSRGLTVRGTKGSVFEDTKSVCLDGVAKKYDKTWNEQWGNFKNFYEEYDSEIWKEFSKNPKGTHGGMDYLQFSDFFDCLINKKPMPIDVYDAAVTMAITPLSEQSLLYNKPIDIPDFTEGRWMKRLEFEKAGLTEEEKKSYFLNNDTKITGNVIE